MGTSTRSSLRPSASSPTRRAQLKALDASESMDWPVTPQELRDHEQEIEGLRTKASHINTKLSAAERELSDKASIIEDLEVQGQIQEAELADVQDEVRVKDRLIEHLQREVMSQKELI